MSLVLKLMRHLQTAIQHLCVTTLLHLAMNRDDSRYVTITSGSVC